MRRLRSAPSSSSYLILSSSYRTTLQLALNHHGQFIPLIIDRPWRKTDSNLEQGQDSGRDNTWSLKLEVGVRSCHRPFSNIESRWERKTFYEMNQISYRYHLWRKLSSLSSLFRVARCSTPFLPFCRSTSVLLDVTSYWTVSSKLNLTLRRRPRATSSTTTRHPYPIWFYHFWFHTYDYIYSYR